MIYITRPLMFKSSESSELNSGVESKFATVSMKAGPFSGLRISLFSAVNKRTRVIRSARAPFYLFGMKQLSPSEGGESNRFLRLPTVSRRVEFPTNEYHMLRCVMACATNQKSIST